MSYNTGTYDIAAHTDPRMVQISNLDEFNEPSDQHQQRLPEKKSHHHHRSRDDSSHYNGLASVPTLVVGNPLIDVHVPYLDPEQYSNTNENVLSIQTMIIGPTDCMNIIKVVPRKLFAEFSVSFHREDTVADLMRTIFITRFKKSHWAVHVLYQNMSITADDCVAEIRKQAQSVLYILLIKLHTSESSRTSNEGSLNFHDPPDLSHSADVLIRVFEKNTTTETKSRIIRIPNVNMGTAIVDLKQLTIEALTKGTDRESNLGIKYRHHRFYYYGYELINNMRYIEEDKLPRIFDFVSNETQTTATTSLQRDATPLRLTISVDQQLSSFDNNPLNSLSSVLHKSSELRDNDDNGGENDGSKNEICFAYFALIYYVRLSIHAGLKNRNENKTLRKGLERANIFGGGIYETNTDDIHESLSDLYNFCDKDKSSMLDEHESKLGLLTLFQYINQGLEQNHLTVKSLIPLIYRIDPKTNTEYFDKHDFQTLIIDTLTEHVRSHVIRDPTSSGIKNSAEIIKETQNISESLNETLQEHLNIRNTNKSPFQVWKIILCILSPLTLICLPIIVFITLLLIMRKGKHPLMNKRCSFGSILLIICCILISFIAYLILLNLILYHLFYRENSNWRVNSLEVYWPFALMIYFVAIYYLYLFVNLAQDKHNRKSDEVEETYNDAEIELLKDIVKVTTTNGNEVTVAEFELRTNRTTKIRDSTVNKNCISNNLKNFFYGIYEVEFEKISSWLIVLKIISLILIITLAALHTCIPVIHRNYFSNRTDPNTIRPFQVPLIEISYYVLGFPMYLIFLLMGLYAFHKYKILHLRILQISQRTTNDSRYKGSSKNNQDNDYYLNLKYQDNLDLFLALIRKQYRMNNTIQYRIAFASMCGALIFDLILAVVSFIRLIYYGVGGITTLTSTFALIDMIILTILIISFLIGIAVINSATTTEVLELLLRTKKEAISDTSKRSKTDKEWNVAYLTATNEYLAENQHMYSITLMGWTINTAYISGVAATMLAGIGSVILSMIQKQLNIED